MGTLSKDTIERIERELSVPYGMVDLDCDGYRVAIRVEPYRKLSYSLTVYVNGQWRGEWVKGQCEEARRFMCPSSRSLYTPKRKAEIVKALGKRQAAKVFPKLNEKMVIYLPNWRSPRSMLRHFCKTNERIAVLSVGMPAPDIPSAQQ